MTKKIIEREPIANGQYYPDNKKELNELVKQSIDEYKEFKIGSPFGLIMPYIDYKTGCDLYGIGYAQLLREKIDTVIIISPVHKIAFHGIALTESDLFKTPSGDIFVDKDANNLIYKFDKERFVLNDTYHNSEYSIEVQLPYIYHIFGDKIKIVPVLIGETNTKYTTVLSNAIKNLINKNKDKKYLIIAATNLSEEQKYEIAQELDDKFIDLLNNMNADRLSENLAMREVWAVGGGGVITLLRIAEDFNISNVKILKYLNTYSINNNKYKTSGYLSSILW